MVTVKSIDVTDKFGMDSLHVTFSIVDMYEDLYGYIFNLYRSYNPLGEYALIASDITNFYHKDTMVNLYSSMLNYYYKVEVVERANPTNKSMSDIYGEYKAQVPDNEAIALIEINNMYLKNAIRNSPMFLFKRKRGGQLCFCYDAVRDRPNPSCPVCYGVKYTGGYDPSQQIDVCFLNVPAKHKVFNQGEDGTGTSSIQVWTTNFPLIQNDDILVDRNNKRYIVSGWQPSYKNFYLLRQTFVLENMPSSNIIFKIPI